jgi:hypothetical protein
MSRCQQPSRAFLLCLHVAEGKEGPTCPLKDTHEGDPGDSILLQRRQRSTITEATGQTVTVGTPSEIV